MKTKFEERIESMAQYEGMYVDIITAKQREIRTILHEIAMYYAIARGAGHTELMLEGLRNARIPHTLLVNNHTHGQQFRDARLRETRIITRERLVHSLSRYEPLIIEHHSLASMLREAF